MRPFSRSCLARSALLASGLATPARAQEGRTSPPLPGFTLAGAALQRALEADAIARPSATIARTHSRELSKETHVAGSPAQERPRDYVIERMRAMGLETEVRSYDAFMPYPT